MNTIEVVVYGSPSIRTVKRLGYMRENGRSSYVQLWPQVAVWYGQSCVRVKAEVTQTEPDRTTLVQQVQSVVNLGKLAKVSTVKVFINGILAVKYSTLADFVHDTEVGQWNTVVKRLKEVSECV